MTQGQKVSVGIVGASGYGGVQLVRLLKEHPLVELVYLGGDSSAGKPYPRQGTDSDIVYQICSHSLLPHPQTRHRQ